MNSIIDDNNNYDILIQKQYRGKENQSQNRNSIKYQSITQVIEKTQQFQHLKLINGQYWGQLKQNKANGNGCCFFTNGSFYYGEWLNNNINGIGVYFFNIGGYIKGEFKDNKADGNCELQYQNGQLYQGKFKDGKQYGIGYKISKRGKEIVQYKDGIRININEEIQIIEDINLQIKNKLPQIYIHNDRIVYGLQCDLSGLGVIQYQNGRIDMGYFQNGSLNGKGRIIFKSGDIYDGLLKNGYFQGQGYYLNYNSKQVTEGIFEKNQIINIDKQYQQYPPGQQQQQIQQDDQQQIVDQRIIIKNIYLKIRQMTMNRQLSSDKKNINNNNLVNNKVNKIQNLIQHMLYPIKKSNNSQKSQKSDSGQHEELIDNLLSRVQSPQQRKNLEQIINQVTSPQRIR